jgi:type IV pilus assembly protein PilE
MRKEYGFTLLEMMITVAIIGILAGIAAPIYRNYIERSYTTEGLTALSAYQLQMEQYYQDNGNYGGAGCGTNMPNTKHFNYNCTLSPQGYLITATANGGDNLTGYIYTVDNANNQSTVAFPKAQVPANCWLTRASGC